MPVDPQTKSNAASRHRRTARKDTDDFNAENSIYVREIELKRSRGEISCAECRRLKIRCDKSIPCQSCQRRGCAALCPNGSLATGQGTRFVLAATEHLHRRVAKMSERIRELEDALAIVQAKCSDEPHPLLNTGQVVNNRRGGGVPVPEQVPSSSQSIIDTFGMLSISDEGVSTFFGPTGGTEYLLVNDPETTNSSPRAESDATDSTQNSRSPPALNGMERFSSAFPFNPVGSPHSAYELMRERHLPPFDRASHLAELYLEHAAWIFTGVSRQQLLYEMLPYFYERSVGGEPRTPAVDYGGPHDLALLFFIFAIGALVDFNREPYNAEAEHYHQLAQAAICLQSVWEKPTLTTIQAIHLSSVYIGMAGNELGPGDTSMEKSWGMVSLAAQLSQIIGLHRDSARWELPDGVVNRRRLLFWNIFEADAWQSLTTGRPPTFSRAYIDCRFPQGEHGAEPDESDFESWFMRFAYQCVAEVAMRTLTAEPPSYDSIMELDRLVREFPIPPEAIALLENLAPPPDSEPPSLVTSMEYFVISHSRDVLLLYIHRSFFAQAIIDCPSNPAKSLYAHSFLTAYRASRTVLKTILDQFAIYPSLCARIWPIWTYGFSAAVVFAMVVTRAPDCPLASDAMTYLNQAAELFSQAAQHSRRAAKALVIVLKLRDKARNCLATVQNNPSSSILPEGIRWDVKTEDDQDELEIFAGWTRVPPVKPPQSPSRQLQPQPSSSQTVHADSSSDASNQPLSFLHPQPPAPTPPVHTAPAPGWNAHQMQMPAYASQAPEPWLRHGGYAQPQQPQQEGYGWSGPAQSHPVPVQPHIGDVMAPYQTQPPMHGAPSQNYRQHGPSQVFPHAFPGMHHAPYVPPAELVDLGLASRESHLDARWASFMHDSGLLDDPNYRT